MKRLKIVYLFIFALFLSLSAYSQQRALTSIDKNVNDRAADLEQKLNFTLDTLTLRHPDNIYRVTILSHDEKDSIIIDVDNEEVRIPLYHLKKGRYTISIQTPTQMLIVGATRLSNIPVPKGAIADLEESILRSSLSEEEQLNRNIKPLRKKILISNDDDTRLAEAKPKAETMNKINKVDRTKSKKKAVVTKPKRVTKTKNEKAVKAKTDRVAAVKPKKTKTKSKRKTKKRPHLNQKSAFAIAVERKEAEKKKEFTAVKRADKGEDIVVTKAEESQGTLLVVKKVTYNLSKMDNDKTVKRQSREEYRANNLRPNGKRYSD